LAYLDRQPSVSQSRSAQPLERLTRSVEFQNVTLADRNSRRLLDNASFTIPAEKRIAIVATDPQTPLGVAGLFVRFYDPASGRILFDDKEVSRATLDTVRDQAMLVTQHGSLFPSTINENIACGDSGFTNMQIIEAARKASIERDIRSLPEGFATHVGNHEIHLRPSQIMRVGIARALLRNPSILIVEEGSEDLDDATAAEVNQALANAAVGRTLIVLPIRQSTLRNVDRIFLFHLGKLEAEGTHNDLIQTSELYRHINYVRFNQFGDKVK
jgi:ABC-type multidrug transport system fused ATPase/permease subunit